MVTLIVLRAIRGGERAPNPLSAFKAIEHLFLMARPHRYPVVGLAGLSMLDRLDWGDRFNSIEFWRMHPCSRFGHYLHCCVLMIEPIVVHRRFGAAASRRPGTALAAIALAATRP